MISFSMLCLINSQYLQLCNHNLHHFILLGFDLITQFQLDVIALKGVRKVDGSTSHQVAYRLDREANFQIPTM